MFRRAHKTTKARQNALETGCEFALPFVFSPYFADTSGGKGVNYNTYSSILHAHVQIIYRQIVKNIKDLHNLTNCSLKIWIIRS